MPINAYAYSPYHRPVLASAALVTGLGLYSLRHRAVPGAFPLAISMFVVAPTVLGTGLEMMAASLPDCFLTSKMSPPPGKVKLRRSCGG
jgi:hypothetical protein